MKTIFDAVNELRGDLNNAYLLDINNDVYLFHCIIDGDYVCSPSETETDDTHEYVCTRKEFNALVEEMTLGLDVNSVTKYKFSEYLHEPKSLLEKETKQDYKPLVYTQEMVDNGELPIVGMEFMGKGYAHNEYTKMWFKLEALGIYSGSVIAESCSEANEVQLYSEIKPIDNRTDKERAIDEFMAKNLKGGIAFKHLISKAYDEWVGE